jgi:transcriptional regulator with XRE-family HTH domain
MLDPRQLIAARALAGWSQADLAAAAKVGLRTVAGLESGARDTKFSSVVAIVEALRRRGVELAQGTERFVGGVLVVRGGESDWLLQNPAEEDPDQIGAIEGSKNTSDEATVETSSQDASARRLQATAGSQAGAVKRSRPGREGV